MTLPVFEDPVTLWKLGEHQVPCKDWSGDSYHQPEPLGSSLTVNTHAYRVQLGRAVEEAPLGTTSGPLQCLFSVMQKQ